MECEKQSSIVVRYIPQYVVVETRYKPMLPKNEPKLVQNISEDSKYSCDDSLIQQEMEHSLEDIHFDQWNDLHHIDNENTEASDRLDIKEIDDVDVIPAKTCCSRDSNNFKTPHLLNEWFLSHLHNPYPTEEQKDSLVLQTSMTKRQINNWFINKRKRSKSILDDFNTKSVDYVMQSNEDMSNLDSVNSTTVELEVIIQPTHKKFQKKKSKLGNLPAICDVCGKTFSHRYMLQSHLKRHDPSTWEECNICHKSFPDGLKRHMRVHSGERPYICDQCGSAYKQAYGLTMHKALHNDSGELLYCDICKNGRGYKSKYALKDHLKIHHRVRNEDSEFTSMKSTWKPPKICTICGFETYNIRSHMIARHSTLRPFKCDICSETFKFKKDLQAHYAYHSDEMNFQCEECEKRFKTKRKLVIHKRIHSSEKLYKCNVCDRSFLISTYLTKHMRIHTGEKKRHACTECSKDYSGITDLRRHLEREHGIKVRPNPKYSNNNMTKKYKIV